MRRPSERKQSFGGVLAIEEEALESDEIGTDDAQEIVSIAGHPIAFHHFRPRADGALGAVVFWIIAC